MLDNGGKTVNLRYEGRNLMVEAPSLNAPYGLSVFDKTPGAPPKYSLDLSFRGADDDEKVRALQTFFEEFDERMIDAGVENAQKWWKMTNANREVIKAFYTPMVKISRDQAGNPKPYPPTVKLQIRKRKEQYKSAGTNSGYFETEFYNGSVAPITAYEKDVTLDEILCKRSQLSVIAQCTGIWFAGGKFGTTWKAVQVRVDSQPEQIAGRPAFRSEAPDIRAFVSRSLQKAASVAVEDEEEDDDDDDEDVVAAVLPPPSKAKVAPAPAQSNFVEEEDISEPVPVPKKVMKKVVKK